MVKPSATRYLQIVSLPDHPQDSFVVITPTDVPAVVEGTKTGPQTTVAAIPAGPPTDAFTQLLGTKLGPLWQPRQLLAVVDGIAYQVGDFRVRAGELRQGLGGAQLVRGVVVEVAYVGQDDEALGRSGRETMIIGFWQELGVKGAKQFFKPDLVERDGFEDVRLWCSALMLKS